MAYPLTKMTPKLQKVCNLYLKGMSMREALLKAGYSDAYASHNSHKFLKNRAVQKYIRERQQAEADAALVDAVFIQTNLRELSLSPDPQIRIAALKVLNEHAKWNAELEERFKELDKAPSQAVAPVTININEVKKEQTDAVQK